METALAQRWWAVVLRGGAAIVFGVLTLLLPAAAFAALVLLFGLYAVVDGVLNLASALGPRRGEEPWWVLLIEGAVSLAAGVATFAWPDLTAFVLLTVIGAWAVVTGVLEIAAAIRLRRAIDGEWMMALGGALSIGLGALLFVMPIVGALALLFAIGVYAIAFGALLVGVGVRLRRSHQREVRPLAKAA